MTRLIAAVALTAMAFAGCGRESPSIPAVPVLTQPEREPDPPDPPGIPSGVRLDLDSSRIGDDLVIRWNESPDATEYRFRWQYADGLVDDVMARVPFSPRVDVAVGAWSGAGGDFQVQSIGPGGESEWASIKVPDFTRVWFDRLSLHWYEDHDSPILFSTGWGGKVLTTRPAPSGPMPTSRECSGIRDAVAEFLGEGLPISGRPVKVYVEDTFPRHETTFVEPLGYTQYLNPVNPYIVLRQVATFAEQIEDHTGLTLFEEADVVTPWSILPSPDQWVIRYDPTLLGQQYRIFLHGLLQLSGGLELVRRTDSDGNEVGSYPSPSRHSGVSGVVQELLNHLGFFSVDYGGSTDPIHPEGLGAVPRHLWAPQALDYHSGVMTVSQWDDALYTDGETLRRLYCAYGDPR